MAPGPRDCLWLVPREEPFRRERATNVDYLDSCSAEAQVSVVRARQSPTVSARLALRFAIAMTMLLTSRPIMAQQCGLTTPLVIKDLQSGYVGQTGTVWTLEPDCSYSVARQIGLKIGEP